MSRGRVVLLAGHGDSTAIVYNALAAAFDVARVIREKPVPVGEFLRRRARRYGLATVAGQVLFRSLIVPYLQNRSQPRLRAIRAEYALDPSAPPESAVIDVPSANSDEALAALKAADPAVVVVNGTRILSSSLLERAGVPFVNMHAGITPKYRGVHGAYWALTQGDRAACGVTVHALDAGIDTGPPFFQAVIAPGPEDNFVTYPMLQLGVGVPFLVRAVSEILEGRRPVHVSSPGPSRLWTHPTLASYLSARWRQGVR